jgi:hypothetical protein
LRIWSSSAAQTNSFFAEAPASTLMPGKAIVGKNNSQPMFAVLYKSIWRGTVQGTKQRRMCMYLQIPTHKMWYVVGDRFSGCPDTSQHSAWTYSPDRLC